MPGKSLYSRLAPALTAIRDQPSSEKAAPSAPDRTGEGLKSAAKQAFKGMSWDELEAQSPPPPRVCWSRTPTCIPDP